jgi:hypothetical protein
VGDRVAAEDKKRIEDIAAYLVRNPLSLKKLVYLDGQQAVLYRSRMSPALGRSFEAMDPLEWLARISDHIPDPGQHRTLFYGEYSNRTRGAAHCSEPDTVTAEPPPRRRCSPSWARLTMPSAGLCRGATRGPFGWRRSQLSARHNHTPSKKARRVSGGR